MAEKPLYAAPLYSALTILYLINYSLIVIGKTRTRFLNIKKDTRKLLLSFVFSDLRWSGNENIATYNIQGGTYPGAQLGFAFAKEHMFDGNPDSMWHSKVTDYNSVIVEFLEVIDFKVLRIQTRKDSTPGDRYNNVCLYADDVEVYCRDW